MLPTHCDPEVAAAGASLGLGRGNRGQLAIDHVLDLAPSPHQGGEMDRLHHIISRAGAPYKGEKGAQHPLLTHTMTFRFVSLRQR